MASPRANVFVTGVNGYIGNAVAHAFVRAGYKTYGLTRQPSLLSPLAASETIPLLGSPSDTSFLPSLSAKGVIFSILVSTTEDVTDYIPHYNAIITLFRTLSASSNAMGIRPLVLFTSGCKDYGPGLLANDPELAPHTELSPLNPPPSLANRANYAIKTFENTDLFDAVVLRPTNVYGYSSSYYSFFFRFAEEAKRVGELFFDRETRSLTAREPAQLCSRPEEVTQTFPNIGHRVCPCSRSLLKVFSLASKDPNSISQAIAVHGNHWHQHVVKWRNGEVRDYSWTRTLRL